LFIVGPCSIHDPKATIEYAKKLKKIADTVNNKIIVVMRLYFEKPRTISGWKGLISDPYLNGTYDIEKGYYIARKLMLEVTDIGLPIATELLDPITPQYLDDIISWAAIGARTIESPIHRQMVSGLSVPTGFKNATSGHIDVAMQAILASKEKSNFCGINHNGRVATISTHGNPDTHLILRGGKEGPNYAKEIVSQILKDLISSNIGSGVIIDCSHANSNKDYTKQSAVLSETIENMRLGLNKIVGIMLESNLVEGNQTVPNNLSHFDTSTLTYGQSITDACIGWDETENIILDAQKRL
jgi:3-deoxy-7-phosphoheptulonate synthase